MAYEELKAAIRRTIKNNDNQEITGDLLQNTLLSMVDTIGTTAGGGSGSGSGSGVSLGTLLAQLNNENPFPTANGQVLTYDGSNFVWKTPTGGSGVALNPTMSAMNDQLDKTTLNTPQFLYWDGSTYTWKNESEISGGSGSIQVAQTPEYSGGSENWVSATKLRFVGITGTKPTIRPNSDKGCVDVGIPTGSGSGSSGTTAGKLYFRKDTDSYSEAYWNGESNFRIIFGSGLNVTWDSNTQITLSATGGSGGSTSTSVSWTDVTNKPSTFTPSSHTHTTNEITGLSDFKASSASAADRLANAVTLWGNNFSGNNNIGTASSHADLRYVKDIYAGSAFDIETGNNSLLKVDGTPTIYVGFGYMADNNARLLLFGNKTTIYTSGDNYHYDFKSNVFDVNSNQIHFGSETNGGKIYWDEANNAFKIEGNVYATGGITALGVSNNATTSNNVDFTFRSVTANTFNVKNSIQLSDSLSLVKFGKNVYLGSDDGISHNIYLDGMDQNYYLSSEGNAYFNSLDCDILNINGVTNFEIINADDRGFTLSFVYNGRTYHFTPSEGNLSIS